MAKKQFRQCIECEMFESCQEHNIAFADDAACSEFELASYLKNDPANREIKTK